MTSQFPDRCVAPRRALWTSLAVLAAANLTFAADYIWKRDANAPLTTASNWFTGGQLPYSANTSSWTQATVAPTNGDRVVGWTAATSNRVATFGTTIRLAELTLSTDTVPALSGYAAQIGLSNNVTLAIDVLNLGLTDNTQTLSIRGGGATTILTIGELNLTRGVLTTSATSVANYFVGGLTVDRVNFSSGVFNVTVAGTTTARYQLGLVTLSGPGTKTLNLAQTPVGTTPLANTAVVSGLTDTVGSSGAVIQASDLASTAANTPTLEINVAEGSHYSTATRLRDNAGNGNLSTLKLVKSGTGTQTLVFSGATNDYSGSTEIQAGTLLVAGAATGTPILGTGSVSVQGGRLGGIGYLPLATNAALLVGSGGTLLAGDGLSTSAALIVQNANVTLSGGATLAFISNADGSAFSTLSLANSTLSGSNVRVSLSGLAPTLSADESLHLVGLITGLNDTDVSSWTLTGLDGFTAQFTNVGGSLNATISHGSVEEPVLTPTGAGVQVGYAPSPSTLDILLDNDTYITDPAIGVMPDGSYLMAHSYFGGAIDTTTVPTRILRSTDHGATWSLVAVIDRFQRASFFSYNGVAYCVGTARIDGSTSPHLAILKSIDNGLTWTARPTTTSSAGYIRSGDMGTPSTPVFYGNRVWIARSTLAISGDLTRDLMTPAAWTLHSNSQSAAGADPRPAYRDAWPSYNDEHFSLWSDESQIVASPATGAVLLPKVQMQAVTAGTTSIPHYAYIPTTALHPIPSASAGVQIDPANLFVPLPGTQAKFGATYDASTGKFYALTNTVLPAFETYEDINHEGQYLPELIRNTGTLYSSRDLVHWDLEKIFIHSDNVAHNAWQYFNFVIHGNHILVASRTALRTPQDSYDPPRGHDSNLLTFHRIANYKSLTPTHRLAIESGRVTRAEITDYQPAPLGNFALGLQPSQPVALAEAPDHSIIIQQQDGQLLNYDAQGNYLSVLAELPANTTLTTDALSVTQLKSSQRTWTQPVSGDWYDPRNWHYFSTPDTVSEAATLGSAATSAITLTIDRPTTLHGLTFRAAGSYTIAAGNITATNGTLYNSGSLTLATDTESATTPTLSNQQGNHTIAAPLTLTTNTTVTLAAATTLHIANTLTLSGDTTVKIDLANFSAGSAPLWIQTLARDNASAKLTIQLANIPTLTNPTTPIIRIDQIEGLTSADIAVTAPDGTPVPFNLSSGALSLSAPLDTLTAEELLTYALTETIDTANLPAHLPVLSIDANGEASFTFARRRSDLNYSVELSTDLELWTTVAENPGTVGELVTVHYSPNGASRFFLRLKVAIP